MVTALYRPKKSAVLYGARACRSTSYGRAHRRDALLDALPVLCSAAGRAFRKAADDLVAMPEA